MNVLLRPLQSLIKFGLWNNWKKLRLTIVILFCILLCSLEAAAQLNIPLPSFPRREKTKPKSASDLLKEEANKPPDQQKKSGEETESMLSDFLGYYLHGWLPTPFPAHSIYLFSSIAWIINDANNIQFPSLPRINSGFSPRSPYSHEDDRKPRPRSTGASDTARAGDYVNTEYDDVDILYEIALPIPLMLRVGVGYAYQRSVLFAKDRTMSGLSPDGTGERIPLQEIHTLDMQEHFLRGTFGVKIPIYGAFADMLDQRISSYYYLYLGAQAQYNVFNRAVQHAQLQALKPGENRFRYGSRVITNEGTSQMLENGTDTLQLWNAPMPTLQKLRIQPEIAFGWGVSGEANIGQIQAGLAAIFELYGVVPLQTVTTDTPWRQWIVGGRVAIGWHRRLGQ
ncbi:MAG: hypothetical protein ACOVSW_10630 [Candidatus Kapaibacteriota bacterium]